MPPLAATAPAPLPRGFFGGEVLEVAAGLVGAFLVRRERGDRLLAGRIVEVEAYGGEGVDPSAHSFKGPTPRCEVMFGPPGRSYVYATQGRCCCLNVSAGPVGRGQAVLLRAVEPVAGIEPMRARRLARLDAGPTRRLLEDGADHELARGPGRLCLCIDVTRAQNDVDLSRDDGRVGSMFLAAGEHLGTALRWTPRIGLNPASASYGWRWRAIDPDSRAVSRPKIGSGRRYRQPRPESCPAP